MTLPKNITDAIDAYARAIAGACANFDDGTPNICRTALEAAIADHIADTGKKVEPPTDAEVEAWERSASHFSIDAGCVIDDPDQADIGTNLETFVVTRGTLKWGLALMRRARATGSLERLRERVQERLGESLLAEDEYQTLLEMRDWIDKELGA